MVGQAIPRPRAEWWGDTRIVPPDEGLPAGWSDVLKEAPAPEGAPILLAELFARLPVALLVKA